MAARKVSRLMEMVLVVVGAGDSLGATTTTGEKGAFMQGEKGC